MAYLRFGARNFVLFDFTWLSPCDCAIYNKPTDTSINLRETSCPHTLDSAAWESMRAGEVKEGVLDNGAEKKGGCFLVV